MDKPKQPYPPSKYEYDARVERRYIYKQTIDMREDADDDDDEEDADDNIGPENVTLAWLLKNVPAGVDPNKVKIETIFDHRYAEWYQFGVYYEEKTSARKKEHKEAMDQYEKDLTQYRLDLEKYEAEQRENKIKSLKAELASLQGEEI